MLIEQDILDRGFTLLATAIQSNTNRVDNRTDYLAYGTNIYDLQLPIIFNYFDNGESKITSYSRVPLVFREYYFIGNLKTPAQLDDAIASIDFELSLIDLDTLEEARNQTFGPIGLRFDTIRTKMDNTKFKWGNNG